MDRNQYSLNESDRVTLQRELHRQVTNTDDPQGQARTPLPTLAKAAEDVATFASSNFVLQAGRPGSLSNSTKTRNAYALADISNGDFVRLDRYVGEDSKGFWAACPCGSTPVAVQQCGTMVADTTPAQIEIVIAGMTFLNANNDFAFNTDPATSLNGTHVIAQGAGTACGWLIDIPLDGTEVATGFALAARISWSALLGPYSLEIVIFVTGSGNPVATHTIHLETAKANELNSGLFDGSQPFAFDSAVGPFPNDVISGPNLPIAATPQ